MTRTLLEVLSVCLSLSLFIYKYIDFFPPICAAYVTDLLLLLSHGYRQRDRQAVVVAVSLFFHKLDDAVYPVKSTKQTSKGQYERNVCSNRQVAFVKTTIVHVKV